MSKQKQKQQPKKVKTLFSSSFFFYLNHLNIKLIAINLPFHLTSHHHSIICAYILTINERLLRFYKEINN